MSIEFWLIGGDTKLRLPVNPESNSHTSPFDYDDYEVEGLGEVTKIKRRGLREFTISSFFPSEYNSSYCAYPDFPKPQKCYSTIEGWRNSRKPIRYVVTGAGGVNLQVTIRDIELSGEQAGAPGDLYYTIKLKEYREPSVTVVDTSKKSTPAKATNTVKRPATSTKSTPKSYVVQKNDSLWTIAKRLYGSGAKYTQIYAANKKLIGANPNALKIGMKLVIP